MRPDTGFRDAKSVPMHKPNTFRDAQDLSSPLPLPQEKGSTFSQIKMKPALSHAGSHSKIQSLKHLRQMKETIRNHVMQRVDTMGFEVPRLWKDELFQNELTKLDIRNEIKNDESLRETMGPHSFNLSNYDNRYFEQESLQKNFQ